MSSFTEFNSSAQASQTSALLTELYYDRVVKRLFVFILVSTYYSVCGTVPLKDPLLVESPSE